MKRAISSLFLIFILAAGCRSQENAIVVRVVLPAKSRAFEVVRHRFLDFSAKKPVTASGQRIVIDEVYPSSSDFEQFVTAKREWLDIAICDSQKQATAIRKSQGGSMINACGKSGDCPSFVFSSVPKEKREAVEQVFRAITSDNAQ